MCVWGGLSMPQCWGKSLFPRVPASEAAAFIGMRQAQGSFPFRGSEAAGGFHVGKGARRRYEYFISGAMCCAAENIWPGSLESWGLRAGSRNCERWEGKGERRCLEGERRKWGERGPWRGRVMGGGWLQGQVTLLLTSTMSKGTCLGEWKSPWAGHPHPALMPRMPPSLERGLFSREHDPASHPRICTARKRISLLVGARLVPSSVQPMPECQRNRDPPSLLLHLVGSNLTMHRGREHTPCGHHTSGNGDLES